MEGNQRDWIQHQLPGWQQLGNFLLWGSGRVLFSLCLFAIDSLGNTFQLCITTLKWTRGALTNLVKIYDQLPYAGTYGNQIIDTTAIPMGEPENIITNIIPLLQNKHCLIVGDTGSGKSTIAQWLAYQIGGTITVYDPDAAPDEWQGLGVIGKGGDFTAIANAMKSDLSQLQERLQERAISGDKAFQGRERCYIAEEFPLLADEVDVASEWLLKHARRGRKPKCFVIALSQTDSVKALGIEGDGAIRNCFRYIRLGKYAVNYAKSTKNYITMQWLTEGNFRCMIDDYPVQLPDLTQFRAVTQQLRLPPISQPVTTVEPELQPISDDLQNAVKACIRMGLSDSKIIKEIMGYGGNQYQQGKELLEKIKAI